MAGTACEPVEVLESEDAAARREMSSKRARTTHDTDVSAHGNRQHPQGALKPLGDLARSQQHVSNRPADAQVNNPEVRQPEEPE